MKRYKTRTVTTSGWYFGEINHGEQHNASINRAIGLMEDMGFTLTLVSTSTAAVEGKPWTITVLTFVQENQS